MISPNSTRFRLAVMSIVGRSLRRRRRSQHPISIKFIANKIWEWRAPTPPSPTFPRASSPLAPPGTCNAGIRSIYKHNFPVRIHGHGGSLPGKFGIMQPQESRHYLLHILFTIRCLIMICIREVLLPWCRSGYNRAGRRNRCQDASSLVKKKIKEISLPCSFKAKQNKTNRGKGASLFDLCFRVNSWEIKKNNNNNGIGKEFIHFQVFHITEEM